MRGQISLKRSLESAPRRNSQFVHHILELLNRLIGNLKLIHIRAITLIHLLLLDHSVAVHAHKLIGRASHSWHEAALVVRIANLAPTV